MYRNANDAYLESRVFSADPVELIRMLYQGALDAVREARRCLAAGEIAARSRSITKAWEILMELTGALDRERGGEISGRLAQLYEYLQRRLLDANLQQSDAPLAEAEGLLTTLLEAWSGVRPEAEEQAGTANPWAQMAPQEAGAAQAVHGWSL